MKRKVAFYTLGCKVNFCETESLQSLLGKYGYAITGFENKADIYVINTCTVTAVSDHKSRKMIRRARRRNPQALIVATGCYAQAFPEEIKKLGRVDLIIGTRGRESLPQILDDLDRRSTNDMVKEYGEESSFECLPPVTRRGRARGFLKVQEGCNESCTYCIVPRVRGPQRSLPIHQVVERARSILQSGSREIVLTGIHLGLYGAELQGVTLASLLTELEQLPGLIRLRLSSLEPGDITGELVEKVAGSGIICPHLHIPLQSGDEEVLRWMNRRYNPEEFLYLIKWLQQSISGLSVTTDVIVGFPGESEGHHRRSMEFVRRAGFSGLHVFKFSPRPGTVAAGLPGQLDRVVKDRRSREMLSLGSELSLASKEKYIGTEHNILMEKVVPKSYGEGFTPHYLRARVELKGKGRFWRGKLIKARLEKLDDDILWGVPISRFSKQTHN